MPQRTLERAREILEQAKASRAVDLHPYARQHQIRVKDIETVLGVGQLGYGETPAGEEERYTLDHQFQDGKRIRLVLTVDENPAFVMIIAAYDKW